MVLILKLLGLGFLSNMSLATKKSMDEGEMSQRSYVPPSQARLRRLVKLIKAFRVRADIYGTYEHASDEHQPTVTLFFSCEHGTQLLKSSHLLSSLDDAPVSRCSPDAARRTSRSARSKPSGPK